MYRCSSAPPAADMLIRSSINSRVKMHSPETAHYRTSDLDVTQNMLQSHPQSDQSPEADERWSMTPPSRRPYRLTEKISGDSKLQYDRPPSSTLGSLDESEIPGDDPGIFWRQTFFEKRDELQQALKEVEWARKQAELIVEEKVIAASLVLLKFLIASDLPLRSLIPCSFSDERSISTSCLRGKKSAACRNRATPAEYS